MSAIVLASGSAIRREILGNAGLRFDIVRPDVDETAIKTAQTNNGTNPADIALILAETKALAGDQNNGNLVIGADQILAFDGKAFDKPTSMEEARTRLLAMQGNYHELLNGVAVAKHGEIIFRAKNTVTLHMRKMSVVEIDTYLDAAGTDILSSVAAYQVEKLGARLFERIDGDYFSVLGLHLFPLLQFLRDQKAISF